MTPRQNRLSAVWHLALALMLLGGCGRPTVELELITPQQPIDREIARDLARYAGDRSGVRITLIEPPPPGEKVLDALESGYGDIAFASNDQPYRETIATILPLYPTVLHILVHEALENGDRKEMLTGANVFAGPVGSASRNLTERVLGDFDIGIDEVTFLERPDNGVEPDIVVLYTPIDPSRVPELPNYQMVSFGEPDSIGKGSQVDRVTLLNPRLQPFIIPEGTYGDLLSEPVVTVAVDKLLVARRDLAKPVAYDLIREILRTRPALSGNRPSIFHALSDDIDVGAYAFAMHPGAQAYIERNEPSWVERYSGVGEVLVALMVAGISGTFAAVKIYHRRRKNRIDVFYKNVFALLGSIDESSSPADRVAAIGEIRALQKRAFDMLVDEKVAADESFRIFVTLSNDAISDLEAAR